MSRVYTVLIGLLAFLFGGCEVEKQEELQLVQESEVIAPVVSSSIVFIAGYDEGNTTYYQSAKTYFEKQGHCVVSDRYSLKEIMEWLALNKEGKTYSQVHIVSHSNAWRGMSMRTTPSGPRITETSLKVALDNGEVTHLSTGVDSQTELIFHSCGLGENQGLMKQLQRAFARSAAPIVYASPFFNVFEGKYKGHYLAKPFYVYYPTAQSKGPKALADDFAYNYPDENINWMKAIKTRSEAQVGTVYSYRFNVPIKWTFTFDDKKDIPVLESPTAIMDWIVEDPEFATTLLQMNIPIERYRWTSRIVDNELRIYGKTTVVCVMEPVMDPQDPTEYETPCIENNNLYKRV